MCVLEVMTPQRSNFVLTTDIPYCETDVLVLHRLYIKTWNEKHRITFKTNLKRPQLRHKTHVNWIIRKPLMLFYGERQRDMLLTQHYFTYRGNRRHNLSQFELVQNSRLSSSIQTHHEDPHLLLPKQALEEIRNTQTHCGWWWTLLGQSENWQNKSSQNENRLLVFFFQNKLLIYECGIPSGQR